MDNLITGLKCSERWNETFGANSLADADELDDAVAQHRLLIEVLAERLLALEATQKDILDRHREIKAAEELWTLALRARDRAVFVNQAGEVAIVPAALMDLISSGRAADVRVSKVDGGVLLDDEREERATVPLSFFINLARIARQWETGGMTVPVLPVPRQPERRESAEEESHEEQS